MYALPRHRKSTETKYFEGTGYAKLAIGTIRGSFLLLEQSLNTRSVDGLLFYIGNQVQSPGPFMSSWFDEFYWSYTCARNEVK